MAGYSGKPLVTKLGIKEGFRLGLVNPPAGFRSELDALPAGVEISIKALRKPLDLIIFFAESQAKLKTSFTTLARKLPDNGTLWIAWPKKASGMPTDLSENIVRQIGLDAGLVDVKICAINDIWSGLKFVYRLKDRASR